MKDPDDLSGTTLGGVTLFRRVAKRVLTEVYEGREADGSPRAVKILAPEAVGDFGEARFVREGRIVADLDHPGLLKVHRLGYESGRFFLVLEWLADGTNLLHLVQKQPLNWQQAVLLVARLCEPVAYLHEKNLVHRDLKPGNVCLRPGGHPVLMDFTLIKDRSAELKLTQTGTIMGTVGFLAPEQAEGRFHDVGPWTDVYGLGSTLYFLLTGKRPFKERTPLETIIKILRADPPPPSAHVPGLPVALDALVVKLLAKDPAARPNDARAVAAELNALL